MKKLPDFLESRKRNYLRLEESLRDQLQVRILPQPVNSQMVSSHYCMGALLSSRLSSRRPEIINELKELGVGTSIYYPHPVPEMSYYRKACIGEVFPNARLISESMIALPVGPHLDQTDMTRISESLSNVLEKHLQIT